MLKRLLALAAFAVAACTSTPEQAATQTAAAPAHSDAIEVMILGTYHFGNPGADLNNARVDPVTTPEKQAQLADLANALARFSPTAIAVERVAQDPATMLDHRYPDFKPEDLLTNPDERVQIGYRLARQLNLSRVYAIDEQDRPGEMSYFPYNLVAEWAAKNGKTDVLQAGMGKVQAMIAEFETRQKTETVRQLLAAANSPDSPMGPAGHDLYMEFMGMGSGNDQPGAVLNGRWYQRNAVIFARLRQVAKPGDRILVIYGAGHSYWLRHFADVTPGYKLVEATDYLK